MNESYSVGEGDMIFVARGRHGCYITAVPARSQTLRCERACGESEGAEPLGS